MQRNLVLAPTVIVCLTAILIAWSPWGRRGRYQLVRVSDTGAILTDSVTGDRWNTHGEHLGELEPPEVKKFLRDLAPAGK